MFTIQFVNAFTQEILRELECPNLDRVNRVLASLEESTKTGQDSFIVDNERRLLKSEFVSHTKIPHENIYKAFFKVKLHEKQPIIR